MQIGASLSDLISMNDTNDNTKESKTDINNGKSTVNKKPMDFQLCFIN